MKTKIILILFSCLNLSVSAQSSTDTVKLEVVQKMTKLSELFTFPGDQYQLDHFVAFFSLPGIDPVAAYNRGSDFTANTIENMYTLTRGSKLSLLVYAINNEHPETDPVKLPKKEFFVR